jgi:hypothetical protein
VTDLSGRPYIFTGPTANTEYYIRTTPYISAGFLVNQYISDFTLPSITSISATTATDTTTDVAWEGLYNDDRAIQHIGVFDVSGVPDLSANGCLADDHWRVVVQHAVLFQGDAVFVRWGGGAVSSVVSVTTQPAIVSVSSEVIDNSGLRFTGRDGRNGGYTVNTTGYLTSDKV